MTISNPESTPQQGVSDEEIFEQEDTTDEEGVSDAELFGGQDEEAQTSESDEEVFGGDQDTTGQGVSDEAIFGGGQEEVQQTQEQPEDTQTQAQKDFDPEEDHGFWDFSDETGIEALDFSEEAIGEPLERGIVKNIPNALSHATKWIEELRETTTEKINEYTGSGDALDATIEQIAAKSPFNDKEEMQEFQENYDQGQVDGVTRMLRRFADSWHSEKGGIESVDTIWDMRNFQPNRALKMVGEQAPLTAAIAATSYISAPAGIATMIGIEGGSVNQTMDRIERNREARGEPEEFSFAERLAVPLTGGSFGAAMEYTGLQKIFKATKMGAGLRKKTMDMLIAAGTEGGTEVMQELPSVLTEAGYEGEIPDDIGKRAYEAFYGGMLVGGGMSSASALLQDISLPSPSDADLQGFDMEGNPEFKINKPGHDREGQTVGYEDISQMEDVQTPAFRRKRMKQQALKAGFFESAEQAEAGMLVVDAMAEKRGMNSEEFIQKNIEDVQKAEDQGIDQEALQQEQTQRDEVGETLTSDEYIQTLRQVSAYHGTPHRFEKFSLDHVGDGEGFQAYGWGLYFTESQGVADWYARNITDQQSRGRNRPVDRLDINDKRFDSGLGMVRDSGRSYAQETMGIVNDVIENNRLISIQGNIDGERFTELMKERAQNRRAAADALTEEKLQEIEEVHGDAQDIRHLKEKYDYQATIFENLTDVKPDDVNLVPEDKGQIYKVKIDDSQGDWLPWRENISQEQVDAVRKALENHEKNQKSIFSEYGSVSSVADLIDVEFNNRNAYTGKALYKELDLQLGSPKEASKVLAEAGFTGSTYKADSGRSEANNYVVFDDSKVEVVEQRTLRQLQQDAAKAEVRFDAGKATLRAFESADVSSFLHEMAHVYRRTAGSKELAEMEELWDVEDGNWTREKEEAFARSFERFIAEGSATNEQAENVFKRFRNWLLDIYGKINGSDIDVDITEDQREFINEIMDHVQDTEIAGIQDPAKRAGNIAKWWSNIVDWFDIEAKGRRMGTPETFFNIKNYFSWQVYTEDQALKVGGKIYSIAGRGSDADIAMMSESQQALENAEDGPIKEAARILRTYFDKSLQEYKELGGMERGFKERLIEDLNKKKEKLINDEAVTEEELAQIETQIENVQDIEFVHIPFYHMFKDSLFEDMNSQKTRRYLGILSDLHQRDSLTLTDLVDRGVIDKSDIDITEILRSYSRQKGRDIALLNTLDAARREGLAVPEDSSLKGYKYPEGATVFKGYKVHPHVHQWLKSQVQVAGVGIGKLWRTMNLVKMGMFWNPLIMPMYNAYQQYMSGTLSINPAVTVGRWYGAYRDVMSMSDRYMEASRQASFSHPFTSPVEEVNKRFETMKRSEGTTSTVKYTMAYTEEVMIDVLKRTKNNPIKEMLGTRPMVSNLYQASWQTAWMLDNVSRLMSYNYMRDVEGMAPKEAAETAALAFGDYAGIPTSSRQVLNKIFFTPSFKIGMAKWMIESIRSMGNVVQGNATNQQRKMSGTLIRTAGLLVGFDMMMVMLWGFDRDEFGRRYTKEVQTDSGTEEMVMTWTGPFNLFLKYWQRTANVITDPASTNAPLELYEAYSWELHPFWNVLENALLNNPGGSGKIYNVFDDTHSKIYKSAMYIGKQWVSMVREVFQEEDKFGQRAQEKFIQEHGMMWEGLNSLVVSKYLRSTPEERLRADIMTLQQTFEEEVGAQNLVYEIQSSSRSTSEVVDDYVNGRGPFDTPLKGRSQNFVDRVENLLENHQEKYYSFPMEKENPESTNSPAAESDSAVFGDQPSGPPSP